MICRRIFLLVAAASLAGCAASSAVVVGKVRSPIPASEVKLYLSPPKMYEEVAVLDASSRNSWAVTDQGKMDVVVQRLKEEAAKLGANGILIKSAGTVAGGSVIVGSGTATQISGSSFGTGVGTAVPVFHKGAGGVAIFVVDE